MGAQKLFWLASLPVVVAFSSCGVNMPEALDASEVAESSSELVVSTKPPVSRLRTCQLSERNLTTGQTAATSLTLNLQSYCRSGPCFYTVWLPHLSAVLNAREIFVLSDGQSVQAGQTGLDVYVDTQGLTRDPLDWRGMSGTVHTLSPKWQPAGTVQFKFDPFRASYASYPSGFEQVLTCSI
ncbi:MAG: hypothetical protein K1X64_04245 [Myxococcaceae bacterium]|nr:hypothetical protein [Myxococcaceae bacterium]